MRIEDNFYWEVPKNVDIKYEDNANFGCCTVTKNTSARRFKKWKQKNDLKENDDGNNDDDNKEELKYIGGVDISATKPGAFEYDKACAGLMIYEYPSMKLVHEETEIVTLKHPYIAGFLAFREVSYLIKLVNKLKKKRPELVPQIILVDGNGILHYRRVGLATHLSMRVNIPCVGIAKKLLSIDNLNVEYLVPHLNEKLTKIGSFYKIHGWNNDQVGYAVRTHQTEDVVFVSPGNDISFESALKMVMLCLDPNGRYKLPLPTEKADFVTRKQIYRYQKQHINPYAYNNEHNRNANIDNKNDDNNGNKNDNKNYDYQSTNQGSTRPGDWDCYSCSFHNFAYRNNCKNCGNDKTSNQNQNDDNYYNDNNNNNNEYKSGNYYNGSSKMNDNRNNISSGYRPGDWNCSACNFVNFSYRNVCKNCGNVKSSSNQNNGDQNGNYNNNVQYDDRYNNGDTYNDEYKQENNRNHNNNNDNYNNNNNSNRYKNTARKYNSKRLENDSNKKTSQASKSSINNNKSNNNRKRRNRNKNKNQVSNNNQKRNGANNRDDNSSNNNNQKSNGNKSDGLSKSAKRRNRRKKNWQKV